MTSETNYLPHVQATLNGDGVIGTRNISTDRRLNFYALGLEEERTGLHGKLYLYDQHDGTSTRHPLGRRVLHDRINLDKNDQRLRFANSSNKLLGDVDILSTDTSIVYSKESLKIDLDSFCDGIWQAWLGRMTSTAIPGDPMLEVGYRIKPFALKDGGTIMYARPKRGKSYVAMAMAVLVDSGNPYNKFWQVDKTNVLYVNLERSAKEMTRRLGCVNTALGLDPARPLRFIHARGFALNQIADNIEREINEHDCKWIVLDSISRSGMGDLNENRTANRITDTLNGLIKESDDRGYLAVAHTSWEEQHVYGSIMFEAAADVMLSLKTARNNNNDLGVKFEIAGANDVGPMQLPVLKMKFDSYGLQEMTATDDSEFSELEGGNTVKEGIVSYLNNNRKCPSAKATPSTISDETGLNASSVRSILTANPNLFVKIGKEWGLRRREI